MAEEEKVPKRWNPSITSFFSQLKRVPERLARVFTVPVSLCLYTHASLSLSYCLSVSFKRIRSIVVKEISGMPWIYFEEKVVENVFDYRTTSCVLGKTYFISFSLKSSSSSSTNSTKNICLLEMNEFWDIKKRERAKKILLNTNKWIV